MLDKDPLKAIEDARRQWEQDILKPSLERLGARESPSGYYTPADIDGHDFLAQVGFPGQYPYTAYSYPSYIPEAPDGASQVVLRRAGGYSGYATAEDTRDYYRMMAGYGRRGGPNLAFDLPTQLGYDSDHPLARGEVGKVGVAVDSLRDFEVIYEAFTGDNDLDRIASNFTINAPCNVILAMYLALARQRGIPLSKLRGTPQNDILKEFIARGTYIFPPRPAMRLVRDTLTFCHANAPAMNVISICMYHIREAGATASQALAFTFANAMAYVQLGLEAGLDVDDFIRSFTFLPQESGSMEILKEIARARAARRMWARIMKELFRAKNPRSWVMRGLGGANVGTYDRTVQRPLNNLSRSVLGFVASALSGGDPFTGSPAGGYPYDEPLGLGHSLEAIQLNLDAERIVRHEARLRDVIDPLAGSYYIESLTDQVEAEAQAILERIDSLGGAVAAIEQGYMQQEIARSAYEQQRAVEAGRKLVVGINCFVGEHELDVSTSRLVAHPYDPERRVAAEARQLASLGEVKKRRDASLVAAALARVEQAARDEKANVIPPLVEAAEAYATVGEMCGVLRQVFGEYRGDSGGG